MAALLLYHTRDSSSLSATAGASIDSWTWSFYQPQQQPPPPPESKTITVWLDSGMPNNKKQQQQQQQQFPPLVALLNIFGSHTVQFQVQEKKQQHSTLFVEPCIWVSSSSSSDNKNHPGPSTCFSFYKNTTNNNNHNPDWILQSPIGNNPQQHKPPDRTCVNSNLIGPRMDFLARGQNFEPMGLWIQASSIRTHRLNLALIHSTAAAALPRNWEDIVGVVKDDDENYKPVQYLQDILTSVFTVLSLHEGEYANPKTSFKMSFWVQLQEVILAGSIPIVITTTIDKDYTELLGCNQDWLQVSSSLESPILTVSSVQELQSLLEETLFKESPQQWDQRQTKLFNWYLNTMISKAVEVEQFLLLQEGEEMHNILQNQALKRIVPISLPGAFLRTRAFEPMPFCLKPPFYGRTNNKVIEVGKLLRHSHHEGKNRAVGLDKRWSKWYRTHFDDRPDVILDYYPHGECYGTYNAKEAFELGDWDLSYLSNLLPAKEFRDAAESIIEHQWPHGDTYISVHRRDLEGSCHAHARCSSVDLVNLTCYEPRDPQERCSVELRLQACNMEYNLVPNPDSLPIVLFTDGQVPALDNTFPHKFNTTDFFVEMWLMVKSKTHWGNPRSTVDAVVSSWRQGKGMEPKECYD
eukprot:scaffold3515_cov126-Cylindrotheca_fusiformis.AAC.8